MRVNVIYGIYPPEHFFVGWPMALIVSIFVVIIIMVFMLWGVETVAYFVVKERNISKAQSFGAKKLPVTFVN